MDEPPSEPIVYVQTRDDQQVGLNLKYAIFLGPLRLLIILFEVGAAIAAGFVPYDFDLFYEGPLAFIQVRAAVITLAIIAIVVSLYIFFLSLLNIVNVVRMVPWLLIFLIIDGLTIVTFVILGGFSCNQEAQIPGNLYSVVYTRGLYATAGIFLYIAALLLIIHSYFVVIYLIRLDRIYNQNGPFDQTLRFNKNYCLSLGWIRVIIMICLLSALMASILINVDSYELYDVAAMFYVTRTASMILTSTALIYSINFYLVSICNCVNLRLCMAAPWLLISMLFDGIFLIAMVITGIVCAVRESQIPWFDYDFVFRRGAYSIAALFEFLAAVFYLLHIILSIPYAIRVAHLPKKINFLSVI